ncbi:Bug family tripartite tricarboxylate transporter substrate binding protein [Roseomonas sp. BN140053]|uniref:Bug family tripartite tricarboxylate transporter substrate binding protein n=1 Tax=Roseomonas sp. BN140053 TaxID=3391898 RepID=UPI0039EA4EC4
MALTRRGAVQTGLAALLPLPAFAQAYPARAVRVIVPFAPGGGTDLIGRTLCQALSERVGQPFVVENRAGGGSLVGCVAAARAAPDGYTLLIGPADGLAILPALKRDMPYDPVRDFSPIALAATSPFVFCVNAQVPVHSLGELVSYARSSPDAIKFGSPGVGSISQLAVELLCSRTGVRMTHVPYRGGGPAVADLLGGQLQLFAGSPQLMTSNAQGGQVRMLAQTGRSRHPLTPDVPTTAELGMADIAVESWFGLLGPAGLPEPIRSKLMEASLLLLHDPAIRQVFVGVGADVAPLSSTEFSAFIGEEVRKWTVVARAARIELQD